MQEKEKTEFYPDFFITPRVVWIDPNIPPMAEKVYSVIHWYGKLKDGYCHASNATIAKNIGSTSAKGVSNALTRLIESGYVHAEYDNNGSRTALIPLVEYSVNPPSNDGGGVHQMMEHNKKTKKELLYVDFSKEITNEVHRLYKGWLIEMVIGPRTWLSTPESSRNQALAQASKRTKLTSKRYGKINARIEDTGFESCAKAIRNISQSDHHRGINDSKWKASIEWLFKDTEKIEEWSNR